MKISGWESLALLKQFFVALMPAPAPKPRSWPHPRVQRPSQQPAACFKPRSHPTPNPIKPGPGPSQASRHVRWRTVEQTAGRRIKPPVPPSAAAPSGSDHEQMYHQPESHYPRESISCVSACPARHRAAYAGFMLGGKRPSWFRPLEATRRGGDQPAVRFGSGSFPATSDAPGTQSYPARSRIQSARWNQSTAGLYPFCGPNSNPVRIWESISRT
jgi:hypothetical protein